MKKPSFEYHDHDARVEITIDGKTIQIETWDMVDESLKFISKCGKKAIKDTLKELKGMINKKVG